MPHFLLSHGQLGPIIEIYVAVSSPRVAILKQQGLPVPPAVLAKGLIDTGASHTAIDSAITESLELSPKRLAKVVTPSTGVVPHRCHTFDVSLHIPFPAAMAPWSNNACEVTKADLKHQGFDVLVGRDILAESVLIYDGRNGTFTLCF
jgi:hypothetical protein